MNAEAKRAEVRQRGIENPNIYFVGEENPPDAWDDCGCCEGYHPPWFTGDCRDDRFRWPSWLTGGI